MSGLARRVRTGATLGVAAAGLLWAHRLFPAGILSLAVVTGLAFLSIWELDRMGSFRGRKLGWMLYFAAGVTSAALGFVVARVPSFGPLAGLAALYVLATVLAWPWLDALWPARSSPVVLDARARLPVAREVVPLALWLLPPLFSIVLVDREFGTQGLVVLVVLAKAGDNAGFFVGRALGKRHPFPRISPGKTVAGCVASLAAGVVVGAILLPLTLGERTPLQSALGALVGGVINVAAQAGDLSESWVKRRAGVKDSSTLLGASGGLLDVIDSLLLAAPVALLAWTWAYPAAGR
jgi:phosphatidate cytidylyltransferase